MTDTLSSLRAALTLSQERERMAVAQCAVVVDRLRNFAYQQGTDSDGWFRMCNLCGEESRVPTSIEPLGAFPHSVACVLTSAPLAQAMLERVVRLETALGPFVDYAAALHKSMPDEMAVTQGSSMARKQLTVGDLRKAAAALQVKP